MMARGMPLAASCIDGATRHDAPHSMKILVLGSGRADSLHEGAVAVCGDEERWLLLNASPRIAGHPLIEAAAAQGRIAGLVMLDARLDHLSSLAPLQQGRSLALYATPSVFEELTARMPMGEFDDCGQGLRWHPLPVAGDVRSAEFHVDGAASLRCVAVDDGGWAAPYSPHRQEAVVGDSIAVLIEDLGDGQRLVYAPGRGTGALPWMAGADCLLVNAAACPRETAQPASGARPTVLVHLDDGDPRLEHGMEIEL